MLQLCPYFVVPSVGKPVYTVVNYTLPCKAIQESWAGTSGCYKAKRKVGAVEAQELVTWDTVSTEVQKADVRRTDLVPTLLLLGNNPGRILSLGFLTYNSKMAISLSQGDFSK